MEDFPYYFIFKIISLAMPVSVIWNLFLFPIINLQSFENFTLEPPCLFIMKLCHIFSYFHLMTMNIDQLRASIGLSYDQVFGHISRKLSICYCDVKSGYYYVMFFYNFNHPLLLYWAILMQDLNHGG